MWIIKGRCRCYLLDCLICYIVYSYSVTYMYISRKVSWPETFFIFNYVSKFSLWWLRWWILAWLLCQMHWTFIVFWVIFLIGFYWFNFFFLLELKGEKEVMFFIEFPKCTQNWKTTHFHSIKCFICCLHGNSEGVIYGQFVNILSPITI